jgi:D-alanyl-D-alanine carboxypeptidase
MRLSCGFDQMRRAEPSAGRALPPRLLLLLVLLLAACGQPGGNGYTEYGAPGYGGAAFAPTHYYPPPGPPEDPWGPYIHEAAGRFGVPEQWVRAVMQQESGGEEQAVSPAGAMGLMQVMPETYEGLRERYGLGADPFDPHNNILAGTAYIREMYDQFGSPGFLAAYNAGPDRVDAYLVGTSNLPDETVNYLAAVTPNLGDSVPMSGPLATYASAGARANRATPDAASLAAGCDLSAAYDPDHPCTSLMRAATQAAPVQQAVITQTGVGGCDLSAAYDPARPCTSVGAKVVASAAPTPYPAFVRQTGAGGCDLSAAYNPAHPCTSVGQPVVASAPPQPLPQLAAATPPSSTRLPTGGCEVNVAYDPTNPCRPAPSVSPNIQLASAEGCDPNAAFDPDNPCLARPEEAPPIKARLAPTLSALAGARPAAAAEFRPAAMGAQGDEGADRLAIPERDWGIQIGAFANPALARAVAEAARTQASGQLRAAAIALPPIASGGSTLYRARLVNLSASAAADACTNLNRRQLPCVVVRPSRS